VYAKRESIRPLCKPSLPCEHLSFQRENYGCPLVYKSKSGLRAVKLDVGPLLGFFLIQELGPARD
jgi:hypothetical protein